MNTIYEALFGMSHDTFIAKAKQHKDYGTAAGLLYPADDEDECARDCLTLEALQALNEAESRLARYFETYKLVFFTDDVQAIRSFQRTIKDVCEAVKQEHGEFPIFSEE